MNKNNELIISGQVQEFIFDHETHNEKFMKSTITATRISGTTDVLPLIISEKLLSVVNIKPFDNIKIKGQLRTRNVLVEGKHKLVLTIFVTDILSYEQRDENEVFLKGFIVKKPTYRKTPNSREITDLLVAVNRNYGKSDYIPCIAWGRNARFVNNLIVGTPLVLAGRFQSREYNKKLPDGDTHVRTAYEVSITQIVIGDDTKGVNYGRKETEQ